LRVRRSGPTGYSATWYNTTISRASVEQIREASWSSSFVSCRSSFA
jgi:hypothetical protein